MFVVCDEISGTRATAIDDIKVPGMVIRGRAIPVIIPNSDMACSSVKPKVASRRGMMNAINSVTIDDAVLASVIEELCFTMSFIWPRGIFNLLPDLKYTINTKILEKTQAIDSEDVAITPPDNPLIGIMNNKTRQTMRINCSKNSEKLIAKNLFWPQRALLKIEYMLEKTSAGVSDSTISPISLLPNRLVRQSLNMNNMQEKMMDITREITSPPVAVLLTSS